MGQRRRAREHALQVLFQLDLTGGASPAVLERFWTSTPGVELESQAFTERLVGGVLQQGPEIDRMIRESAKNWRIERMAVVDRNVLRLAVCELLQDPATPPAVVIDEAVEIAKRFGSGESGAFINGILDAVRRRLVLQEP